MMEPHGHIVVIGCGNLLRGDDAVGPILIRHLWEQGVPADVTLVDGGTAGMDVAFKMRAARLVILIDAAATGSEPGTIFEIPGSEIEQLPPLEGLHTHQFRWDHALAFGHWLLGDEYPEEVRVFLIEAEQTTPGADLSPRVESAMHRVMGLVRRRWEECGTSEVELTADGNLRIGAEMAERWFPSDALVAVPRGDELWLLPLTGTEAGGLLLKHRNARGDRSALVREALPDGHRIGPCPAIWDPVNGALRVRTSEGVRHG